MGEGGLKAIKGAYQAANNMQDSKQASKNYLLVVVKVACLADWWEFYWAGWSVVVMVVVMADL